MAVDFKSISFSIYQSQQNFLVIESYHINIHPNDALSSFMKPCDGTTNFCYKASFNPDFGSDAIVNCFNFVTVALQVCLTYFCYRNDPTD